jgi:hypothetical protein
MFALLTALSAIILWVVAPPRSLRRTPEMAG